MFYVFQSRFGNHPTLAIKRETEEDAVSVARNMFNISPCFPTYDDTELLLTVRFPAWVVADGVSTWHPDYESYQSTIDGTIPASTVKTQEDTMNNPLQYISTFAERMGANDDPNIVKMFETLENYAKQAFLAEEDDHAKRIRNVLKELNEIFD